MSTIEACLSPPRQDRDIASDMAKLGTAVKNHAQSYYTGGGLAREGKKAEERTVSALLGAESPFDRIAAFKTSLKSKLSYRCNQVYTWLGYFAECSPAKSSQEDSSAARACRSLGGHDVLPSRQ